MTGPFSRKISGFSCDLTALQKIKQLRANAVAMRLGVTVASVVRVSALGAVSRKFMPLPCHTKGDKMVLAAPLLTLATKGSVRKIQEDMLRVFIMSELKLYRAYDCLFQNTTLNKAALSLYLSL